MGLSREEVQHIAKLARLGLSEEDTAKFQEQLSEILEHFDVLRQLDTEGVPPTAHTLPLENVLGAGRAARFLPARRCPGQRPACRREPVSRAGRTGVTASICRSPDP